ncbi:hypothetical protein [Alicyclobacillus acidoterrestris]|uniref:Uncharacterized protein n=1 Tax=Alicyclobacillus acidoterrestris (strain ATCC 49025 / DSM 3922 / CIP 106132 / NCIMB 13137 / GD3B) TaxID=1356854 RepID=T0BUZ9_ALIAG|nr:hypothetical protein [Alicyclobacillus acidoterrestris]EPZ44654.1 hypothetical protein N007_10475 [Alicyclobacillus acidoterrestris ATCC 49025]UNO50331.1 hypothetical protein K1I37_07605 [Alicyclobacillus acidoterrestris]
MRPSEGIQTTTSVRPDKEMHIGGTRIRIFAPQPMSAAQRQTRHQAVVNIVAKYYQETMTSPQQKGK